MNLHTALRVLLLVYSIQNSLESNLAPLIPPLELSARVLNGIAIQLELNEVPAKIYDITAEFLGIPSRNPLFKLESIDLNALKTNMKNAGDSLSNVSGVGVQDLKALKDKMAVVDKFKQGVLKSPVAADPIQQIKTEADSLQVPVRQILKLDDAAPLAGFLDTLTSSNAPDENTILTTLIGIKKHVDFRETLVDIQYFETSLKPLFALAKMSDNLKVLKDLVDEYRKFTTSKADFFSVQTDLSQWTLGITKFQKFVDNIHLLGMVEHVLDNVFSIVPSGKDPIPPKQLTIGFPNGLSDLAKIKADVKEFPKILGSEEQKFDFEKEFGSLVHLHKKLMNMSTSWKLLVEDSTEKKNLRSQLELIVRAENTTVPKSATLLDSIQTAEGCFKSLTEPTAAPPFEDFDKLVTFADDVKIRAQELINIAGKDGTIRKAEKYEAHNKAVLDLGTIVEDIEQNTQPQDAKKAWDLAIALPEIQTTAAFIRDVAAKLQPAVKTDVIKFTKKFKLWSASGTMLNSISESQVSKVLQCLKTNEKKIVLKDWDEVDAYGKLVTEASSKMKTADAYIDIVLNSQKAWKQLNPATSTPAKAPARRRRRDVPSLQAFAKLRESYLALGQGVESMREIRKIQEKQASILAISKTPEQVDQKIQTLPAAQKVWTKATKTSLGLVVKRMDEFEKKLKEFEYVYLESYQKPIAEASNIYNTSIDTSTFEDPISKSLASDANTKKLSSDFHEVGLLNLNFANHQNRLNGAYHALYPIQDFFDRFFGIDRSAYLQNKQAPQQGGGGGGGAAASSGDQTGGLVSLCVGSVIIAAGLTYLSVRYGKKAKRLMAHKKLYKDREKHWAYQGVLSEGMLDTNSNVAISTGKQNTKDLKKLVTEDLRMVNFYYLGATPLHYAVRENANIAFLLKNGADQTMRDSAGKTPMDLAKSLYKDGKIEAKLKKYEKKKKIEEWVYPVKQKDKKFAFANPDSPLAAKFYEAFPTAKPEKANKVTNIILDADVPEGLLNIAVESEDLLFLMEKVFNPRILMSRSWAEKCLEDASLFEKDWEHRIQKIQYRGNVHGIDHIKKMMNNRTLPYLTGSKLSYMSHSGQPNASNFATLADRLATYEKSYQAMTVALHDKKEGEPLGHMPHVKNQIFVVGYKEEDRIGNQLNIFSNSFSKLLICSEVVPIEMFFEWLITYDPEKKQPMPKIDPSKVMTPHEYYLKMKNKK